MHPKALLGLTVDLLQDVLTLQSPADATTSSFFRRHRGLGPRERQVLAETVYGALRRLARFDHLARRGFEGEAARKAAVTRRIVLLAWSGDAAQRDAACTPVEREWREAMDRIDESTLDESLRHNLPDWVVGPLREQLGDAGFWSLVASLDRPAPLDLRANALKLRRDELAEHLRRERLDPKPTPHSPWGLRLEGRPALNRLPAFLSGEFEVQDEGSQLLALMTEARRGEMVVDFCAGAGGKTLALGAMMRNTGRLYAFDTAGHRLEAMKPRLARSGLSNVHPALLSSERDERVKRLAGKIDRVLVDAPCSGLGTLRRNPDLKWRQTAQSLTSLIEQQASILAAAARLPKSGGRLVYATCSLLAAENEQMAARFEAEHAGFVRLDAGEILRRSHVNGAAELATDGCLRLWPHRHGTDGFFAVVWQKR